MSVGKKPHRSSSPKLAVRTAYFSGETNVSELARKHNVSRQTIQEWKRDEGWDDNRRQVSDSISKGLVQEAVRKVADETLADIAANLTLHGSIAKALLEAVQTTLDEFNTQKLDDLDDDGKIKSPYGYNKSPADYVNALADAAKKAISVSREIAGLKPGDSSTPESDEDDESGPIEIRKTIVTRSANDNLRELLG